jgi:ATP-dependent RNA helicase DOB1
MKDKTGHASVPNGIQPCLPGERGEPVVIPVLLSIVEKISAIRIHVPKDLRPLSARETLWKSVLEVHKRFPDGLPMLDPIKNMKISDKMFVDLGLVSIKIC